MGGYRCGRCRQAKSRHPATAVRTEADPPLGASVWRRGAAGAISYPFNSFFSSLRKRQSVPWAMTCDIRHAFTALHRLQSRRGGP
jgi:hypothetical protein